MPKLNRGAGVEIDWEERGEGPTLVVAHNSIISMPSNLTGLLTDLAADHRVVTCDPRGTGQSSRSGPYDPATDAEDLAALIESIATSVVTISVGFNAAPLRLVEEHSELVDAVVLAGALPQLGAPPADETGQLFDSDAVAAAMLELMRSEPRALLRTMTAMGNPQLTEDEIRERLEKQVAHCPPEVAVARGEASLGYDATGTCVALGDRLGIIHWENPMSPGDALARVRRLLPEAQLVEVEDGPISRPELIADALRQITSSLR